MGEPLVAELERVTLYFEIIHVNYTTTPHHHTTTRAMLTSLLMTFTDEVMRKRRKHRGLECQPCITLLYPRSLDVAMRHTLLTWLHADEQKLE